MKRTMIVEITTTIPIPMTHKVDVEVHSDTSEAALKTLGEWALNNTTLSDLTETSSWRISEVTCTTVPESKQIFPVSAAWDECKSALIPYLAGAMNLVFEETCRLGRQLIYEVKFESCVETPENSWLFEVRSHLGEVLDQRIVRGREGLNQLYVEMVGYRPDDDEFEPDLNKRRAGVMEMFYRHTTNDDL